jgi:hypothetical protein
MLQHTTATKYKKEFGLLVKFNCVVTNHIYNNYGHVDIVSSSNIIVF